VPCPLLSREVIILFHYFFLFCSRENRTSQHVGRGAPLWIEGWCRSLQDLPSASWYYPQEWLYSHQEPSLQGLISSFLLLFFFFFMFLLWILSGFLFFLSRSQCALCKLINKSCYLQRWFFKKNWKSDFYPS
jgi:hypothetical protein